MPDLGPETIVPANEEPAPTAAEGRLVSTGLSVNMLVGGVLVLLLLALIPFFFRGSGSGRTEMHAPNAPEAVRWNGSNSQAPSWPASANQETAQAAASSPTGNQFSTANNGTPSVVSSQDAPAWSPPQPIPPASAATVRGANAWNSQTARGPAAEATGSLGSGNRSGFLPNSSGVADAAADHTATTWGDPSQSVAAVPQAAPLADPNRPVGPMMPTVPPMHTGAYEAARPAPAYQNNFSEPNAYTADARSNAAITPWSTGATAGPSNAPSPNANGAGATYPNAYSNPGSNNTYPPYNPSGRPSGYPSNASPTNRYPSSANQPGGYPSNVSPSGGYPSTGNPANVSPSGGYPSAGNPSNVSPSGGYPSAGNPSNVSPSGGYPSAGNPSNVSPSGGYPSTGYPSNVSPSGGYPSAGNPANVGPSGGYPSTGYPSTGYPSNVGPSGGYPATGYPSNVSPSGGYPSTGYPANNGNASYPGMSGPAVNPTTNGAAGYNGGMADPATAQFNGGIERPSTPGGYDNARSSLH
jgi:hypothetical protein